MRLLWVLLVVGLSGFAAGIVSGGLLGDVGSLVGWGCVFTVGALTGRFR